MSETMYKVRYTDNGRDIVEVIDEVALEKLIESRYTEEEHEEALNDAYGTVSVCGYEYEAGRALRELDEVAFRCGYGDELSALYSDAKAGFSVCDIDVELIEEDEELKEYVVDFAVRPAVTVHATSPEQAEEIALEVLDGDPTITDSLPAEVVAVTEVGPTQTQTQKEE